MKKMIKDAKIAGALYDFLGYLTRLKKPITLSRKHSVSIATEHLEKWAKKRGLDLTEADILEWNKKET